MHSNSHSAVPSGCVLIVDDDPDICLALADLLEHEGYQIEYVGTGAEAIAKAKTTQLSAVLLDLGLPDIDGSRVLQELAYLDRNLPIIILTAFTGEQRFVQLLRQGAYACLTKPYDKVQLKATLALAVGAKALAARAEQIERRLNDSEQRFQSVVGSATDAIILADEQGRIMSWNQAGRQLFGYTEMEIVGKPLMLLLPARYRGKETDGPDRADDPVDLRLMGRAIELHGLRKDGTEFPAEFCLGLWKSSDGAFYSGFIRDVTEHKQAQARLQESEERLRLALMAANMGIWDWDINNDRVTWSENVSRLFGVTHDAFVGTRDGFIDLVHPDDRPSVAHAIIKAVETGGAYDIEHRIRQPHGEVRWIGCRGRVLCDPDSRPYRLLGTVQDITERKQGEEQLLRQQIEQQVLLDLIPAMVWYKDCHNRIIRANRLAAESIHRRVSEIEGQSTYDLYPEEAEKYYQDDLDVIETGRRKLGIVELYQTAPGEKRWLQTDKVPYRGPEGNILGVLVFAQDITDRRQAEQALQASEARFRAFMDNTPALAFIKDENGRYLYANKAWERRFHKTRDEWSDKTDEDLFAPDMAAKCRESDRRVWESGLPSEGVETVSDAQGNVETTWVVVKFRIRNAAGQPCIGGIAQDLAERKTS